MDAKPVVVRYKLNRSEFSTARRATFVRVRFLWVEVAVGGVVFLVGLVTKSGVAVAFGGALLAINVLIIVAGLTVVPLLQWRRRPDLQLERAATVTDQGVLFEFPTGESRLDWSYFDCVLDLPKVFVFVHRKVQGFPVPKREMSADTEDQLRDLAARHSRLTTS